MAQSDFNYTDYLLYTGAKDVNNSLYATVAHGVLGVLTNQYGIYTEEQELTYQRFITTTSFDFEVSPVNSITSITYEGTLLDPTEYSWYGREVLLATTITDTRIPLDLVLQVGYTTLPTDLKLAIYRHIDAVVFAIQRSTDSIDKVTNSTGNTTYYRSDIIPVPVQSVYEFYSTRLSILV